MDVRANQASSSSRRVRAGKGAPGPSSVGNLRAPEFANGLYDWSLDHTGVFVDVRTGRSGSRLFHPSELRESRNDSDAMTQRDQCNKSSLALAVQ